MKDTQKALRSSNMDMMRIFSMMLIVFLHSIDYSGVLETCSQGTAMYYFVYFGYFLSQVSVNCFVLLSGYFLIESKFRVSKLLSLWLEVMFYSLVIRIIFILVGINAFSWTSIISCFVPVFTGRYWFITIYFGLYLVSPFLNIGLKALSEKQHKLLIIVLFALFPFMVSILPSWNGMSSGGGWGLAWFVVLYVSAAWFRMYYNPTGKIKMKILAFLSINCFVVFLLWITQVLNVGIAQKIVLNWYKYDSAPVYIMSILVLVIFINIKCKSIAVNKVISALAPLTFGVYLIHHHADFGLWMWNMINLPQYMDSISFALIQIGYVLLIFLSCAAIDWVRRIAFNFMRINSLCKKIDELIDIEKYM